MRIIEIIKVDMFHKDWWLARKAGTFLNLPFNFIQAIIEPTKVTVPMKIPISMKTTWMADSVWRYLGVRKETALEGEIGKTTILGREI